MLNSEMNFTNIELNEDIINIEDQNIENNHIIRYRKWRNKKY